MAITKEIRACVKILSPGLAFIESDVSARCVYAAGANALLLANIDTDISWLIGRGSLMRCSGIFMYKQPRSCPITSAKC